MNNNTTPAAVTIRPEARELHKIARELRTAMLDSQVKRIADRLDALAMDIDVVLQRETRIAKEAEAKARK